MKLTLTDILGQYASTTELNNNFALIETALENTLSRDGTTPNTLSANIDMNTNRINNLVDGILPQDAATYQQLLTKQFAESTLTDSTFVQAATKAAAAGLAYTAADAGSKIFIASADGGEFTVRYDVTAPYADNGGVYCGTVFIPTGGDGTIGIERDYSGAINLSWFGAACDAGWDGATKTGTDDTTSVQAAINSCSFTGDAIEMQGGQQSLVGTLYFYYDVSLNPNWNVNRKPGRITIHGATQGLASGLLKDNASAFIHKDATASPLFDITADFETAGGTGGYLDISKVSLIGGTTTTHVIYAKYLSSGINIDRFNIRVLNPAGHGLTLDMSWQGTISNGIIKGDGDSATPAGWTGIGVNVTNSGSSATALGSQINMLTFTSVDSREMGLGWFVGRVAGVARGNFAPLTFISCQGSNNETYNLHLAGGSYGGSFIGCQFEGSTLAGVQIKAETGSGDLARGYTFHECYWTNNGLSFDETTMLRSDSDGYAFNNIDGVSITISDGYMQNTRGGIRIHPDAAVDTTVTGLTMRPRTASNGFGVSIDDTVTPDTNSSNTFDNIRFQSGFGTNVDDTKNVIATSKAGGRASSSSGATPSIGKTNKLDTFKVLNFNHASPTTITDIQDGFEFQQLRVTFSNTNTTIADNANIVLAGGVSFTPLLSSDVLILEQSGGVWYEVTRTYNASHHATSTELNNITDIVNTQNKKKGHKIYNSTTNRPVYANAGTAGDIWRYADGTTANTPV